MSYVLETESAAKPATIEEAYPALAGRRTTTPILFACPDCGAKNGSNVFLDGDVPVVVCGECYGRQIPLAEVQA